MAFFTAVSLIISSVVATAAFKFEKGDNVCLIGNSLPDRFNHDGWFEAVLQSELKGQEVIFRNLGFTGDTRTCSGWTNNLLRAALHHTLVRVSQFGLIKNLRRELRVVMV